MPFSNHIFMIVVMVVLGLPDRITVILVGNLEMDHKLVRLDASAVNCGRLKLVIVFISTKITSVWQNEVVQISMGVEMGF